jgi:methylmalonyl-CoA/ethylmalonyl-CoA epimerase
VNSALLFDHVGLLVGDLDAGADVLSNMLKIEGATPRFDDVLLTVSVRFFRDSSGLVYELIAPLGVTSVISGPLKKGSNIINQIAYRTDSILIEKIRLVERGFIALGDPKPALAFGGAHVQFFMSPLGFVVELIEAKNFRHQFDELAIANII